MKTFNTKLIVALITTLVLTGCMPDSLTKFKKDAPTKAAATDTTPPPKFVDSNGNPVDPDSLEYPSKFYFFPEGSIPTSQLTVGTAADIAPIVDGSIADPTLKDILFVKCELVTDPAAGTSTTTLPPGLGLSQTDCKITGTPTQIHSNNGAPIQYTVQMHYKGENYDGVGTESLLKAHIKIGVYQVPVNLAMTQTDKLQILLNAAGGTLDSITRNTEATVPYDRYGVLTSSNGISGVVKYVDAASGIVGVKRSQAIAIDSVASIGSNQFLITSNGKRGKIVSVNTTTKMIYVEPLLSTTVFAPNDSIQFVADTLTAYSLNHAVILQPLTVSSVIPFPVGKYLTTSFGTKRGQVLSVNTTAKVLFVKILLPNVVFQAADQIDAVASSVAPFVSTKASVNSVTTIFSFQKDEKLDNDIQYFSEKFNIQKITQTFPTNTAIEIAPIESTTISAANGVSYTIAPALPSGLSFNLSTGKITGSFSSTMNSTAFTITATNSLGSVNSVINVAAINAPEDLSYTTRQLISVTTNSSFLEGETLFQPIIAPAVVSTSARILRKVSTNKLSIETVNGNFLAQASLDSGNIFSAIKATVPLGSLPNYYNIALTLDVTANMALFPKGNYISNSSNAKGIIIDSDVANRVLYIRFLTPTVVSSDPLIVPVINTFFQGNNIDNVYPYSGSKAIIDEVEASNMVMTLAPNAAGFEAGHDITSNAFHSGYIYEQTGTTIKVDEINRTGALGVQAPNSAFLRSLQTVSNNEYYAAGVTRTIGTVTHDNFLAIDRGIPRIIYANVSQGTSLNYSISPALPAGLAIDPKTGIISGSATFMSPKTTYVITATNLLGSAYYALDMEVRDYFTFAETSGAKSFLTHKNGNYKTHRACRINAKDILDGNASALTIGCSLEAEEMDLFYTTLKLSAMVGPGTCEYVSFTPYSFWQHPPIETKRVVHVRNNCTGALPAGEIGDIPTPAEYCIGNYAKKGGPNCDTGAISVIVWTGATPGAACTVQTPQTVKCDGRKAACLSGPITSVLTNPIDIDKGFRSMSIESSAGLIKEWPIKSPFQFFDTTNIRNANSLVSNQCSDTNADAKKWKDLQAYISPAKSPFGGESPFYEFNCLDAAKDVKASIRLTIRDWDRSFRIKDFITELIPGGAIPTAATAFMNSIKALPTDPSLNNYFDWDNAYNGISQNVLASSCGALPAGACSAGGHLTIALCQAAGQTWNDPGSCSTNTFLTRSACETANETWIPVTEGVCNAGGHTTRAACLGAGQTWMFREFPFPGDNI